MTNTLNAPALRRTLTRMLAAAESIDAPLLAEVRAHLTAPEIDEAQIASLLRPAYLAVSEQTGRLLYQLVRMQRSRTIVEFGSSFGVSTLHLAAAVRDNGVGRVIGSEQEPDKVRAARENLCEAELSDVVEVVEGDALVTLAALEGPIDFLFLDGWKPLYLSVLRLLEPRLAPDALVLADDLHVFPAALVDYLAYVRDPANGYVSVELANGDGMELSVRS